MTAETKCSRCGKRTIDPVPVRREGKLLLLCVECQESPDRALLAFSTKDAQAGNYAPAPWTFTRRGPGYYISSGAEHVGELTASSEDAAYFQRAVNSHDELLEACEAALAMPDGVHVSVWNEVREQLRRAVAKAKT